MTFTLKNLQNTKPAEEEEEDWWLLPCKSGKVWLQDKNSKYYWKIAFAEIGKTVFLTREEAEKALKEMG